MKISKIRKDTVCLTKIQFHSSTNTKMTDENSTDEGVLMEIKNE